MRVAGIGAPVVVGLILGLGIGPLASGTSAPLVSGDSVGVDPSIVTIEEVTGEVRVRTAPGSGWRSVETGDTVVRPVTIRAMGLDAFARMTVKGTRIIVAHDSRVHIGATGTGMTVQVEEGLLLAYREKQPVVTLVPSEGIDVRGHGYGVWVREGLVTVAVLADSAEVSVGTDEPTAYPFGREVTIESGRAEQAAMGTELTIEEITKRRRGRRSRISARTASGARVFKFGRDGFEEIDVRDSGTFRVTVPGETPAPGGLIALDAAGRWAELDRPSRRLEQVVHDLKTGRPQPARIIPRPDPVADRASSRRPDRRPRRSDDSAERSRADGEDRDSRRGPDEQPERSPESEMPEPPPLDEVDQEELDERAL